MEEKKFQDFINAWNHVFYTARKFDSNWGNLEKEELTPNQLAIINSVNDQHNAWYEEVGLEAHELN